MCYLLDDSGRSDILDEVERMAKDYKLIRRNQLQLRLLAEELICFLQKVPTEYEAAFWIEQRDDEFELHLKTQIPLGSDNRQKIGEYNPLESFDEVNGLMERLCDFFLINVKNYVNTGKNYIDISDKVTSCFCGLGILNWSFERYNKRIKDIYSDMNNGKYIDIQKKDILDKMIPAMSDEIDKSIIAQLSDDIYALMQKNNIEIIVQKKFAELV